MRLSSLALSLTVLAGCGSSPPTSPPAPTPAAPTLSCPASIAAQSLDGLGVPVAFTAPTAAGGQTPVSVTCTAVSDATFPVGSSIVTCTATDALSRTASCNFNITVTVTPRIAKTKFLAFGDSITNGRCNDKGTYCPLYTMRVEELLEARYTAQTFEFETSGNNGEPAGDSETAERFDGVFGASNAEVLLLMEGTNDINAGTAPARLAALDGLDHMIRAAQRRGWTVFLATIPPIKAGGAYDSSIEFIPEFNEAIRSLAVRRAATLVDIYGAMNADVNRYIGTDFLHPSEEGMRLIGETFYAAIRDTLDTTPAAARR